MLLYEVRTPGAFASRDAEKRCDSKSRNEKDNEILGAESVVAFSIMFRWNKANTF